MSLTADDRLDITALLSRYGLLIDQRRFAEWSELFVEDASFEVPGQDALVTTVDRLHMVETAPPGLHMVASPVITAGDDDETATAEQSFLFRDIQTTRFLTGWYEDQLVKADGTWRFSRRRINYFRRPRPAPPDPAAA